MLRAFELELGVVEVRGLPAPPQAPNRALMVLDGGLRGLMDSDMFGLLCSMSVSRLRSLRFDNTPA